MTAGQGRGKASGTEEAEARAPGGGGPSGQRGQGPAGAAGDQYPDERMNVMGALFPWPFTLYVLLFESA